MFCSARSFNQPLNNWNVSNVSAMESMFMGARSFNQPLNDWNVSKVTSIIYMFMYARSFNQPLDNWNVSNVEYMVGMFAFANSFNQPLDKWNVSKVKNMNYMFSDATSFNRPLHAPWYGPAPRSRPSVLSSAPVRATRGGVADALGRMRGLAGPVLCERDEKKSPARRGPRPPPTGSATLEQIDLASLGRGKGAPRPSSRRPLLA